MEAARRFSWTRGAVLFTPVQLAVPPQRKQQSDIYAQIEDATSSAVLGFISERSHIDPLRRKCTLLCGALNNTLALLLCV